MLRTSVDIRVLPSSYRLGILIASVTSELTKMEKSEVDGLGCRSLMCRSRFLNWRTARSRNVNCRVGCAHHRRGRRKRTSLTSSYSPFISAGGRSPPDLIVSGNQFRNPYAKVVVQYKHLTARDQTAIDIDVDGIAGQLIERHDGTTSELQ